MFYQKEIAFILKKRLENGKIVISPKGENPMNDYTFGNFLYALRMEKGFSQAQLGEMLGVTNKAVSKWENGSAKPNTVLIPRLAEIFGVTVEELFACKRLEGNGEYERIKNYLSLQKKKYAVLSSVFLSASVTLPLLLIEFICVVMGFQLPDDVVGPLGAVGFIFAWIVSTTAFVIYRKNFYNTITPSETEYAPRSINIIKKGLWISGTLWYCTLVLLLSTLFLILCFSKDFAYADIIVSIAAFVVIILYGVFICFVHIKRLLKINFSNQTQKERKRVRFSELPVWVKMCYIAAIVLFPVVFNLQILSNWLPIKLASLAIWFGCQFALIFYSIKKK